METVVLDHARKREVLSDINEYLHPATPRWYANRGIPYRRGYLFHGPPGTGKTSLSFALAGVFGLDIYVISLLEPTLTEEDLGQLFNALPRRCVVLLEDIDTAGLLRPDKTAEDAAAETDDDKSEDNDDDATSKAVKAAKASEAGVADLVKALKKANESTEEDKKKGISLSGLLNAIDGVASHEGRLLVMTTNRPEKLDAALIRPGRVDLQVAFTNATQDQIKELFERMYTSVTPKKKKTSETTKNGISITSIPSILLGSNKSASTATSPPEKVESRKVNENGHINQDKNRNKVFTPPPTPTNESSHAHSNSNGTLSLAATEKPEKLSPNTTASIGKKKRQGFTPDELKDIAASFASKIPDSMFSPAEIQGFLLKRKRDPKKANDEVERWVDAMIELKKSKTKVLDVQ